MPYVRQIGDGGLAYPYTDSLLRQAYKSISFPAILSNSLRASYGMYPVTILEEPEYNRATHKAVQNTEPSIDPDTNQWVLDWTISEMTAEEIAANDELCAAKERGVRDRLLAESDWVALKALESGNSVSTEWLVYRQELRMVPQQPNFPHNIDWPTKPL